jgi:hypothetical protein
MPNDSKWQAKAKPWGQQGQQKRQHHQCLATAAAADFHLRQG